MPRKDKEEVVVNNDDQLPEEVTPPSTSIRKLSILLFGLIMVVVVGCSTAVSIHFNDPEWFKYGCGSVFTALLLVAFFGWPFDD